MAAKCKKCDPHEICEECPEWIFTLADLIMCMMGLFVILWCLKKEGEPAASAQTAASQKQEQEWMDAFRKGFIGAVPDYTSSSPDSSPALNGPGEKGNNETAPENPQGTDREVNSIRMSKTTAVGGRLTFAAGSDELSDLTRQRLDAIAATIKGHRNIFLVKGHTSLDDLPNSATDEQLMDLSVRRARRVQAYLVSRGVQKEVLRVVGCSAYEPVVQRVPAPQQALNRRVEVDSAALMVEDLQDPQQQQSALPTKPEAPAH